MLAIGNFVYFTVNWYCGHLVYLVVIWYMYIFCGHLENFVVIWKILWSFGIFCGHLEYIICGHLEYFVVIFPFWYVVPRNIWQPCSGPLCFLLPNLPESLSGSRRSSSRATIQISEPFKCENVAAIMGRHRGCQTVRIFSYQKSKFG
jgi:hypothetical protein